MPVFHEVYCWIEIILYDAIPRLDRKIYVKASYENQKQTYSVIVKKNLKAGTNLDKNHKITTSQNIATA